MSRKRTIVKQAEREPTARIEVLFFGMEQVVKIEGFENLKPSMISRSGGNILRAYSLLRRKETRRIITEAGVQRGTEAGAERLALEETHG